MRWCWRWSYCYQGVHGGQQLRYLRHGQRCKGCGTSRPDPQAVAGLTADAIEALRKRDLLLQKHIERLEWQLQNS